MCGLNLHPKLLIFLIIIDPITTVFIGLVILFYICILLFSVLFSMG
jgi:hypothetical protein